MGEFARFGKPGRFEIAVRWRQDSEAPSRRPAAHGWSMGDLQITVAHQVLTQNKRKKNATPFVSWYLSPLFDWLAANWLHLLHEERFAWQERSSWPAAPVCREAMSEFIAADDEGGRQTYGAVQGWYHRHGLRHAAEGGLFPDIFIRRLSDDIEVSWLPTTPQFAGEDFVFLTEPGLARLAVADGAKPLWHALRWFTECPPPKLGEGNRASWELICQRIRGLEAARPHEMEAGFLKPAIQDRLGQLRQSAREATLFASEALKDVPALGRLSPAVAMFGGVDPNLGTEDVKRLFTALEEQCGGADTEKLAALVTNRGSSPLGIPYRDGYSLAEELLADLGLPVDDKVDVRKVSANLGIAVGEEQLQTNAIRGVAIAGDGFHPKILVNLSSAYNRSEAGRRFTIAHELCHILYDRSRARRVTHVSGPWVAPGYEKRANAFAAFLLMPRNLVVSAIAGRAADEPKVVAEVASSLDVSESALVEHLYNLRLIQDWQREGLRGAVRQSR